MSIDWQAFTPVPALIGGAVIGLAAALFFALNGRIAGISGIVGGLLRPQGGDVSWRIAFVAGLIAAPLAYGLVAALPEVHIDGGYALLALAGLIVGVGTRYGAGCTSGHGVCGISRLSPRSIVATLLFMGMGFATVFAVRHLAGIEVYLATSFVAGLAFGLGLIVAGMANPAKVLGFLDLAGAWDPSLALVMVGAIAVGAGAFALMRKKTRTLLGAPLLLPGARTIDRRLVIGSSLFGVGWGLAGICPGPALVLVGYALPKGFVFFAAMIAGMAAFEFFERKREPATA